MDPIIEKHEENVWRILIGCSKYSCFSVGISGKFRATASLNAHIAIAFRKTSCVNSRTSPKTQAASVNWQFNCLPVVFVFFLDMRDFLYLNENRRMSMSSVSCPVMTRNAGFRFYFAYFCHARGRELG